MKGEHEKRSTLFRSLPNSTSYHSFMRSRGYQVGLLRAVVIFKAPDPKIKHPPKFTTPIQLSPVWSNSEKEAHFFSRTSFTGGAKDTIWASSSTLAGRGAGGCKLN